MTFELIKKMILRPREAFTEIKEAKPLYSAVLYLLVFGIIWYIFIYLYLSTLTKATMETPLDSLGQYYTTLLNFAFTYSRSYYLLVLSLVMPFVNSFFSAAIYNLLAELTLKKTNGIALFIGLVFASVPTLIERIIFIFYEVIFKTPISPLISLIFVSWSIYLFIMAIRETYDLHSNVAIILFLLPIFSLLIGSFYFVLVFKSFGGF